MTLILFPPSVQSRHTLASAGRGQIDKYQYTRSCPEKREKGTEKYLPDSLKNGESIPAQGRQNAKLT
jgi:hypothetical protein